MTATGVVHSARTATRRGVGRLRSPAEAQGDLESRQVTFVVQACRDRIRVIGDAVCLWQSGQGASVTECGAESTLDGVVRDAVQPGQRALFD